MCKVQNLSSIPKRKKRAINKRQPIHKRVRWIIHNLFQCFRVACTRHPHHRAPLGVIETLGGDRRTPRSSNSTDKIGSNYRSAHGLLCLHSNWRCFHSFLEFRQYNENVHNTHAHSHLMNTRTQTLPLWAPPKDWAPANLKIPKSPLAPRRRRERRLPLNV